ncbi:MAG: flagellar hook-associated protein FlgK [Oligoflexia bacterium]|nr:flagellar hook-associated protein FlgK [Oligoflexia bacterium]
MARISSLMHMGKQSMSNSQTALQTTSHNVANANTEGYTRQRVEFAAAEPVQSGRHRLGQGAKQAEIKRISSEFLNKQIRNETGKLGWANGKQDSLVRVEQIYNESINKGLNNFLSRFFNAFREFSNNPESQATRALVKESGKVLVGDFHRIDKQLNDIQADIDVQIKAHMAEINGYASGIAKLNEKIHQIEVQGMHANDERDQRDLMLKKLSDLVNIRYAEGDNGNIAVTVGNTAVIVSGNEFNELHASATSGRPGKREGNFDIFFKHGPYSGVEHVITNEIKSGKIGGLLEVRDVVINDLHDRMDHIAYNVAESVNTIHEVGFDRYNKTGTLFFNQLGGQFGAASDIGINQEIANDPGKIAAALQGASPGDNRVANAIAALETKKLLQDGTSTVNDYFNGMVGEFAVLTSKNDTIREHQKNIVSQLNNVRESISGVSLDEEVTDMIKYQKAFDASARLIKTADEMFDTVINLKRL